MWSKYLFVFSISIFFFSCVNSIKSNDRTRHTNEETKKTQESNNSKDELLGVGQGNGLQKSIIFEKYDVGIRFDEYLFVAKKTDYFAKVYSQLLVDEKTSNLEVEIVRDSKIHSLEELRTYLEDQKINNYKVAKYNGLNGFTFLKDQNDLTLQMDFVFLKPEIYIRSNTTVFKKEIGSNKVAKLIEKIETNIISKPKIENVIIEGCSARKKFANIKEDLVRQNLVIEMQLLPKNLFTIDELVFMRMLENETDKLLSLTCASTLERKKICIDWKAELMSYTQKLLHDAHKNNKVFDINIVIKTAQVSLKMASICDAVL